MAAEAHQPNDADRGARGKAQKSPWRHVAAIADSAGDLITITHTVGGVVEDRKQSAERPDGHAQAA
jgi:hypothetical protein